MHPDPLDTILAHDEELVPSSGFLSRVIDRVQEEAAVPPPIPFPWKRALPGIVLALAVLGGAAYEMARYAAQSAVSFTLPHLPVSAAMAAGSQQAGWVLAGLGVSACAWLLARRFAGRSGLL